MVEEAALYRARLDEDLQESENDASKALTSLGAATDASRALEALRDISDGLVGGGGGGSGGRKSSSSGRGGGSGGGSGAGDGGGSFSGNGEEGEGEVSGGGVNGLAGQGVEPALVQAVTAVLSAAQAERAALMEVWTRA